MLKKILAAAAVTLALCATASASGQGKFFEQKPDRAEVQLVAQMAYCEARGEGDIGMRAVAHVILNRVEAGRWGDSTEEVMSARHQFTCWRMLPRMNYRGEAWEIAQEEARAALAGVSTDPTLGATHYHATYVSPRWSRILPRLTRIGRHIFYV